MARMIATLHAGQLFTSFPAPFMTLVAILFCASIAVLVVALCTVSENQDERHTGISNSNSNSSSNSSKESSDGEKSSGKSSGKALTTWLSFGSKKFFSFKKQKSSAGAVPDDDFGEKFVESVDSPVWQRMILMGERCEPPTFSGLILYDDMGNQVPDFPNKSPRVSVIPPPFLVSA